MKRGKAPDTDGLTVEHLQFSHPVLSVLLSKLFMLIILSCCVPKGFKRSYIVPIPKVKDCRTKVMSCSDFRGIAISPTLSKVFEHCLLKKLQSFINYDDSQLGFKNGLSCSHAIYTVCNIVNRWVSRGFTELSALLISARPSIKLTIMVSLLSLCTGIFLLKFWS